MSLNEELVSDEAGIHSALDTMAAQLAKSRQPRLALRLIGIRSRGVPLGWRLARLLEALDGGIVPVGALDITLYRDDLEHAARWPVLHGTKIPFDVERADIVLVDDVLFTGRTVRAALNAVCELGRPARVRLAVLVDRGHRELPIQADAVGMRIVTEPRERVAVRIQPLDPRDEVLRFHPSALADSSGRNPTS